MNRRSGALTLAIIAVFACTAGVEAKDKVALAWRAGGVTITKSGSVKWKIVAAEDASGGAYLAWEENRGRMECCRDTRDIYAQRIGADGSLRWGSSDVKVAAEEDGEQIIGVLPTGDAGAAVVWSRGSRLMVQVYDGAGKGLIAEGGGAIFATPATTEWNPEGGFARIPERGLGVVSWIQNGPAEEAGAFVLAFERRDDAWAMGSPVRVGDGPRLHGPVVTGIGADRWLLAFSRVTDAGASLEGRWLTLAGDPEGEEFRIGEAPGQGFVFARAAGTPAGAFVLWSAIKPEKIERTHDVNLAWVARARSGETTVVRGVAGKARTLAMHVASLMVRIGDGPEQPGTPETMSWRRTSEVAATGPDSAIIAWVDEGALMLRRVAVRKGRMKFGTPVEVVDTVHTGMVPALLRLAGDRWLAVWATEAEDGSRVLGRAVSLSGSSKLVLGSERIVIAEDAAGVPRSAAVADLSSGGLLLGWTTTHQSGTSLVKVQRIGGRVRE